jgi:pilus assembly protein CpaB
VSPRAQGGARIVTPRHADGRRGNGAPARWMPFRPAPPPLATAVALRPPRTTATQAWGDLRTAARRHRRLLAAALVGLAAMTSLDAVAPKPPPTTEVVTAARDLSAGATLTVADLRVLAMTPRDVPAGAMSDGATLLGQQLAAPVRRGEPLTDVRLDDGPLRPPAPGLVSAPVRLADSQAARLLRPGQRIDVLAASTATQPEAAPTAANVVATDVAVLAVPIPTTAGAGSADATSADVGVEGALVVLATSPDQARRLAQAQVSARLSAVVVG